MNVVGFVARFCNTSGCPHDDGNHCVNPTNSKYYINPEECIKIAGAPLVVAHNDRYVVGKCTSQTKTNNGISLVCVIDDVYFLESLRRRYNNYKDKYNTNFPNFVTFAKKTLSSFSLSHNLISKEVRHVSLVDTPGRKGTAVDYTEDGSVVLKRRAVNQHISDIVASHSTAYLPVADRTDYLIQNTKFSRSPRDFCYINANRALKMSHQDQFNDIAEIYRIVKALRKENGEKSGSCGNLTLPAKRNRKVEYDSDEDEGIDPFEDTKRSSKKSRRSHGDCEDASKSVDTTNAPFFIQAMREGVQQGITAALEMFKQTQQTPLQQQQPPLQPPLQQPPPAAPEPVSEEPPTSPKPQKPEVEASRPRTTTITTIGAPDRETLDIIVSTVMGKTM